jgi:hypothetical protein
VQSSLVGFVAGGNSSKSSQPIFSPVELLQFASMMIDVNVAEFAGELFWCVVGTEDDRPPIGA